MDDVVPNSAFGALAYLMNLLCYFFDDFLP